MDTITLIQKYGVEYLGRFYSKYRGVVINDEDPDNLQRLYITIPSIQRGLKVWARPGNQYGSGGFGLKLPTPITGEVVWVEFENGNPGNAIWYHHGWALQEVPEELTSKNSIGLVTPHGNKVYLQDDVGILKIYTEKEIHIESKETIHINSEDIIFKEGETGLPETTKLIKRLNLLEDLLLNLKNAIPQAAATAVPQDGGKTALTQLGTIWNAVIEKTVEDDIQSEHIKQPL